MFNPSAEFVVLIGILAKKEKVKIETHPVTAEVQVFITM